MRNCKDCKWWGTNYRADIRDENDRNDCDLTRTVNWEPDYPTSKAISHAEHVGVLFTAPDFGCIQFEQRVDEV